MGAGIPPNWFLNMRFLIPLLCVICACMPLRGAAGDPSEPPGKGKRLDSATKPEGEELRVKMWYVPYHHSPSITGDPAPETVPESKAQIDAREWLEKAATIHFAPGEQASFNLRFRVLMVRASPVTLTSIDSYARNAWKFEAIEPAIRVEASLVEFSASRKLEISGKASIESLRKSAAIPGAS